MELAQQQSTGTRFLHLLNFRPSQPLRDIPIELRIPVGFRLREAMLECPEDSLRQVLVFSGRQGLVRSTVPRLNIYDLITLKTDRE